jgi:hypothetical protein
LFSIREATPDEQEDYEDEMGITFCEHCHLMKYRFSLDPDVVDDLRTSVEAPSYMLSMHGPGTWEYDFIQLYSQHWLLEC